MNVEENFEKITGERDALPWAEKFVNVKGIYYDEVGILWLWDEKRLAHKRVDDTDLFSLLSSEYSCPKTIERGFRNRAFDAIKIMGRKNNPKELSAEWVQFKEKVVNVKTGERINATKELLLTNPIPWAIGDSEETPVIDSMFAQWVGEENVQLLHEVVAFCTIREYFINRIIGLFGGGSNGKTTFINFLVKFLGKENVTTTELDLLSSNRFESVKLYRKLGCVVGETNFAILEKTGLLKRLTGRDPVRFEHKFKEPFEGESYAKIIVATNSLPITADKTEGFYRRWLIIDFPNQFKEKRDILATIPSGEYENLCKKYIRLAKKLFENSGFSNEPEIKERAMIYESKSNPLPEFIELNYERDFEEDVSFSQFFS